MTKTVQTANGPRQIIDWRAVKNFPPASDKSNFFEETELDLPEETKHNISDLDEEWFGLSQDDPKQLRSQNSILKATQDFINTPVPEQWRMCLYFFAYLVFFFV